MLRILIGALAAWLLTLMLPLLGLAQGALGPLSTSEQNPLYRLLHVQEAESADLVPPGALEFELATSYSSVFEASSRRRHEHLFDLEQMTNALTVRYGVARTVEVGARVGLYTGWEGFLDPVIEAFHDAFGLPTGGRELQPRGQYLLLLRHDNLTGGEVDLDSDRRTLSLEDLRVFTKWRFYGDESGPLALSLRGSLRRASGFLGEGRVDGALSAHGRATRGSLHFHGSTGVTIANPPTELAPIIADYGFFFSTGVEYSVRPTWSLLGQLSGSNSFLKDYDGGELAGVPVNLIFGVGGATAGGWGWQVSFSEDIVTTGPAVDFTVGLLLSRTLDLSGG